VTDEELIKTYVRSQYQLEKHTTPPDWLTGDKRKWWNEEASRINKGKGK